MTSYRQTISKHRKLLSLPIVIVVLLAVWSTAGAPKKYEATASLWVDNLPPAQSSLSVNDPSVRMPADQQQLLVTELIQTRDFRLKVGKEGPLARYLASNPSKGWGPMGLLSKLKGAQPLDGQIVDQFGPKQLTTFVAGPQVLQLTYTSTNPVVAAGTLRALINQINAQQSKFADQRSKATVAFNQQQVDAATKAVTDARAALARYQHDNPQATAADPHLAALQRTAKSASRDLARVTTQLNQSSLQQTNDATTATQDANAGFTVIDAPKAPPGPVSGKKKLILALFGGLFAGGLLSFLTLIALTPSKPAEPHLRSVEAMFNGAEPASSPAAKAPLHRVPAQPHVPEPPRGQSRGGWADRA